MQLGIDCMHFLSSTDNVITFLLESNCFDKYIDFYGSSIKVVSVSNPTTCQQECQQNKECKFWTYDTSSNGIGLNCWLKNKDDFKLQKSERTSGPKYCRENILQTFC